MTYAADHYKVTVYGDAYNGVEQWSFGWRAFKARTGTNDAAAQGHASDIAPVINSWWLDSVSPAFYATHRLQGVKVAVIQPNGLYPPDHTPGEVMWLNVPGPLSTAGASLPPAQTALCVTMTTGKLKGLASKGRFYLPPMNILLPGTDGLMTEAGRDAAVTKIRNLLTAVNNAYVGSEDIAIFSNGKGTKSFNAETGKIEWTYNEIGPVELVTGVSVGKVPDTQRRRRRSLVESREGAALG